MLVAKRVIQDWLMAKARETRRKYERTLTGFGVWLFGEAYDGPEAILETLLDLGRTKSLALGHMWRGDLQERDLSVATVASSLGVLQGLVRFARDRGLCDWRLDGLQPKVARVQDVRGPSRDDLQRMFAQVQGEADAGVRMAIRDIGIMRMLHNAFLRRSEVLGLRLRDVELDHADGARVLAMRKGKRRREPMLIGPRTAVSVRRWLDIRGTTRPDAPLFIGLHGDIDSNTAGPLSGESVRMMLQRRARKAGVRDAVRPHGLRHSAVTHAAKHVSVPSIQRMGGWTSVGGLMPYLDDGGEAQTIPEEL